jgi:hypothetical protein
MKKESQTTYKVGSLREFAEWTKSVVRDRKRAHGVPKKWFGGEETAARTATDQASAETTVKLCLPAISLRWKRFATTNLRPCGSRLRLPGGRRPGFRAL